MKPWSGIILVVVLIGLVSAPALARDEVLVSGPLEYGGYGGPAIRVAGLKGETGIFVGGYGGWVINHTFMFGGGGYGLLNEVKAPFSGKQEEPVYFKMGYGGLVFEYVNNSHRLWHWTVHTLIGMGGIELTSKEDWSFKYDDSCRWKLGFSYEDAEVARHIGKTQVPVLVIHSRADVVTPYFMGRDLYAAVPHGKKRMYTVEDSAHADVFFDDPENYEKEVVGFINQVR